MRHCSSGLLSCDAHDVLQNGQESDAKALVGLLAPKGQLLRAIHAADLDSLIKFEFPLNRLPTYTQQLLRLEAGRSCPSSICRPLTVTAIHTQPWTRVVQRHVSDLCNWKDGKGLKCCVSRQ